MAIPCFISLSVPPGFSNPKSILCPPESSPHPVFIPCLEAFRIEEKHSDPDNKTTSLSPWLIFSAIIFTRY